MTSRNVHQWQQIALFLDAMPARKTLTLKRTTTPVEAQAKRASTGVVVRVRRYLKDVA